MASDEFGRRRTFLQIVGGWFSHAGRDGPAFLQVELVGKDEDIWVDLSEDSDSDDSEEDWPGLSSSDADVELRCLKASDIMQTIWDQDLNLVSLRFDSLLQPNFFRGSRKLLLFTGGQSRLQSLMIPVPGQGRTSRRTIPMPDVTQNHPDLFSLTLEGFSSKYYSLHVQFPHQNLRHSKLSQLRWSVAHTVTLLESMPSLERLSLEDVEFETSTDDLDTITHPSLHHISIQFPEAKALLPYLHLPALTSFQITAYQWPDTLDPPPFDEEAATLREFVTGSKSGSVTLILRSSMRFQLLTKFLALASVLTTIRVDTIETLSPQMFWWGVERLVIPPSVQEVIFDNTLEATAFARFVESLSESVSDGQGLWVSARLLDSRELRRVNITRSLTAG